MFWKKLRNMGREMNDQVKHGYYQWTHDGEPEECSIKESISSTSDQCYHCDRIFTEGEKVFILTSVEDGDIYLLCDKCYRKWVMKSFEKGLDGFTDDIFNDGR
jgi:hypothetical protein